MKKLQAILGVIFVLGVAAAAASVAVANTGKTAQIAAGPSCKVATIGVTGPFTGPAASAGIDQRNWADLFITYWNTGKPIPGIPAGTKRVKLVAIHADTQLNPQVAATVAVQLRSNPAVVLVNGFSGSQENVAGGPILRRGGLGFVSGSATRASLTDPTTPDGHVLSSGLLPPGRAERQLPGQCRRCVHAEEARHRIGRQGHDGRPGRGLLGAAHHADEQPADEGRRQRRPRVPAGEPDRLHVAGAEGSGREGEGGGVGRAGRLERAAVPAAAEGGRVHRQVHLDATAPSTRRSSRCRARTSRRSRSTSTTSSRRRTIVAAYKARFNQDTISFGVPTWVAVETMALRDLEGVAPTARSRVPRRGVTSTRSASRPRSSAGRSRSRRTGT